MKKTAKILALVLALAMLVSLFAACGSKSALVGTWNSDDAEGSSITFKDDGTGTMDAGGFSMKFNYKEKDGKVELTSDNASDEPITYEFSVKDNKLSLKDGETGTTLTYTKK